MTQMKFNRNEGKSSEATNNNYKKEELAPDKPPPTVGILSPKCPKMATWLLVSIGVCILLTTVYVAINQKNVIIINDEDSQDELQQDPLVQFNKTVRAFNANIDSLISTNFAGCYEKYCKLMCLRGTDLYETLQEALMLTDCIIMENVLISYQEFPNGVLGNKWLPSQSLVKELILSHCQIQRIEGETFNTQLFTATQMITLDALELRGLEGSTLVGLYSLKYLVVTTPLSFIDRAFFQPVQSTLTHLVLNAGLSIEKDFNVCGISRLSQLQHLDLSRNNFLAPISRQMFRSMPNLKYLIITEARITQIEPNAFSTLAGKLQLLNLSQNFLTTIAPDSIEVILHTNDRAYISLSLNNWLCDCNILQLAKIVRSYHSQFIDELYCKSPHYFYGINIDKMASIFHNCTPENEEIDKKEEENDSELVVSTTIGPVTHNPNHNQTTGAVFNMRCLNDLESKYQRIPNVSILAPQRLVKRTKRKLTPSKNLGSALNVKIKTRNSLNKEFSFRFDLPDYEFDLKLLPNRSALVTIADYQVGQPIFVVWFNKLPENFTMMAFDDCMEYGNPFMATNTLQDNSTYTFCLLPDQQHSITPFNCLPLYVPPITIREDTIWISSDNKTFTIIMLCVIFILSIFFGATIAYFGIKTYPDLLEGSKNVLVVRKSDRTSYIATISEAQYMHHSSSFKMKPVDTPTYSPTHSFPLTQLNRVPTPPPLPIYAKQQKIDRLPSFKSALPIGPADPLVDDEYEMPKSSPQPHRCDQDCLQNPYAMSPGVPPPLPKRNSSGSDLMADLILNRFSKQPLLDYPADRY